MPPRNTDADAPPGGVRVHASLPTPERRGRLATVISFVVHALIILVAIRLTAVVTMPEHSPIGDAIKMVLGGGGGGGGQHGAAFEHPAPPPKAVVPPPVPPPPLPVPTVTPPPPPVPPAAVVADPSPASPGAAAGAGTGSGGGTGSGQGPGRGSGQGPGSGSGSGGGNGGGRGGFPPVNKQMIIPPTDGVPKELRGKEIEVTFYVTAAGRVSDVKVKPPIANRSFAQKFDEIMRGYTFTPGRDAAGNKVPGVVAIVITFGGK